MTSVANTSTLIGFHDVFGQSHVEFFPALLLRVMLDADRDPQRRCRRRRGSCRLHRRLHLSGPRRHFMHIKRFPYVHFA